MKRRILVPVDDLATLIRWAHQGLGRNLYHKQVPNNDEQIVDSIVARMLKPSRKKRKR